MKEFPALVRLGGGHFPLEAAGRLLLGAAKACDVKIAGVNAAPRHCELFVEFDRWWLRDLGSLTGTWFLGERINDVELIDGDVFVIGNDRYQLQLSNPVRARDASMEARARVDATALKIYSDWLVEQGIDMGPRMPNATSRERNRSLRELGPDVISGNVELEWRDGFVRRASFRRLIERTRRPVGAVLIEMAAHEAFCLLEEITVEALIFEASDVPALALFPGLRRLVIEDAGHDLPDIVIPFPAIAVEHRDAIAMQLRIQGDGDERFEVLSVFSNDAESFTLPPPISLVFDRRVSWDVRGRRAFRINGVETDQAFIRPGDVIEIDATHRVLVESR